MKRALVISALAIVVAACSEMQPRLPTEPHETPPAFAVILSAELLNPGAAVLTLRNDSDVPIGYNLCLSQLQQRTGGGEWVAAKVERDFCTMEIRGLAPRNSATFRLDLRQPLPRGEYRFVRDIELLGSGERVPIVSNLLTVP
jgi:hypothetical protein